MKIKNYLFFISFSGCLSLISACSTNPVSGAKELSLLSEDQETAVGQQHHQKILQKQKPYPNALLQNYVSRIGNTMASYSHRNNIRYHFTVLDDPNVNAFALPGGYIYITTGLMAYLNNEAELAAVLGHEVAHVAARHSASQASWGMVGNFANTVLGESLGTASNVFSTATTLAIRQYGRDHELQADELAAQYLSRAGYAPEAMINVIAILQNYDNFTQMIARQKGQKSPPAYRDLFSTHPSNNQRLQRSLQAARQFANGKPGKWNANTYLNQINGIKLPLSAGHRGTLRIHNARPGETFSNLAQHSRLGNTPNAILQLRLLNGKFPKGEPQAGHAVKNIE